MRSAASRCALPSIFLQGWYFDALVAHIGAAYNNRLATIDESSFRLVADGLSAFGIRRPNALAEAVIAAETARMWQVKVNLESSLTLR